MLQVLIAFFIDRDEEQCRQYLEKCRSQLSQTPLCSPEIIIVVYTWLGLLSESKSFIESEQFYIMALISLHKLYGDPRCRGSQGVPWELLITNRLSLLKRLQAQHQDYEYVEELFDATLFSLKQVQNEANRQNCIFNEIFRLFDQSQSCSNSLKSNNQPQTVPQNLQVLASQRTLHPLSHWTDYMKIDDKSNRIHTLNQYFPKSEELMVWVLQNSPLFYSSDIMWQSETMKSFFLMIMQNAFQVNFDNPPSLSSSSQDRFNHDPSQRKINVPENNSFIYNSVNNCNPGSTNNNNTAPNNNQNNNIACTPKSQGNKLRFDQSSIRLLFERDDSTFSKRDALGVAYSWGYNNGGQLACLLEQTTKESFEKIKFFSPKLVIPLKDTIIQKVACGHDFTMAITATHHLLSWGNNCSKQLGLGMNTPKYILFPQVIPNFEGTVMVSCGSEHSVSLNKLGQVFSWGQGTDHDPFQLPRRLSPPHTFFHHTHRHALSIASARLCATFVCS